MCGMPTTDFESETRAMTPFNPSLRKLALAGAAATLALSASPVVAEENEDEAAEMTKGERELAELLEGRVAGEPVNCINGFPNERLRVIDNTAYVYGRGKTIYVQRTTRPEQIDDNEILVSRRFGSRICRFDNITTVDRTVGFFSGVVFFEDFIPYTRVEEDEG